MFIAKFDLGVSIALLKIFKDNQRRVDLKFIAATYPDKSSSLLTRKLRILMQ